MFKDDDWLDVWEDYQVLYGNESRRTKKRKVRQKKTTNRRKTYTDRGYTCGSPSLLDKLIVYLIFSHQSARKKTVQPKSAAQPVPVEPVRYSPLKIIVILIVIACWLAVVAAIIYAILFAR